MWATFIYWVHQLTAHGQCSLFIAMSYGALGTLGSFELALAGEVVSARDRLRFRCAQLTVFFIYGLAMLNFVEYLNTAIGGS